MYYRLKSFIEKKNIFNDSQYGFREKRSTEHAILDIINQIENNMYDKMYSRGIFINLRSGPFLAPPICSLMSSLAKIGPDQKSLKNSGRSARFWPTKLLI